MFRRSPGATETMPPPPTRHRRPDKPARAQRIGAAIRSFDDWRQVMTLRVVVPLILAVVSFYYLTRWAHENAMPWFLAWTLPAALDVTAYKAVTVARRAAGKAAKVKASCLAWLCVILSVAGNVGSHALDLGILTPNFWTIAATAAVYPLMLAAGHIVAGGMSARPLTAVQIRDRASLAAFAWALTAATARAESARDARATAEAQARELRAAARRRPPAAQPRAETPAQVNGGAPAAAPTAPPAGDTRVPPTPAPAPNEAEVLAEQVAAAAAYKRANPDHGRRVLHKHLQQTWPALTEHAVKTKILPALEALEEDEAAAPAAEEATAEEPVRPLTAA